MRFFRKDRVSSLIREKLAWLIARDIEIPGALVTVTDVDVDKKLDRAMTFISVIPEEKGMEALKVLKARAGEIRFTLLKQINIKPMPMIFFELDRGPENAARVEKALLNDNNKK